MAEINAVDDLVTLRETLISAGHTGVRVVIFENDFVLEGRIHSYAEKRSLHVLMCTLGIDYRNRVRIVPGEE